MVEQPGSHPAASLALDNEPSSPARARSFVASVLEDWRCTDLLDDALLVASELVTNAIRHARSSCELRLELLPGTVRLGVRDHGEGVPAPRRPAAYEVGGRGLPIVAALSAGWGVEPADPGKVVWAELLRADVAG
jgi:anti-sigma regulatory factor (Ser/Thr protein kinase)